ncbi:hypothetical protein MTO96_051815 [Rhipicephalus appendiculatus]
MRSKQEAKRAVEHLRSSSESSEEPSTSSKDSNPAVASTGTSQPIGHGAGEVPLNYPSLKNTCAQCRATLSSRVALEDHYKKKHACQIYWRCSSCSKAHYKTSHSASAHYSRCHKRGPDVQSTNAPASSSAAVASGGTAGPRKGRGAGAGATKGGATPAIHSASSGEDDPFHWSHAEIRKVEAVRLRLGARASHYQTSFHTPGRTCQEIAILVATLRYAGIEASLKRQRAAGESLVPGGKVSGSRMRARGVADHGHSGHRDGGGSGRKDVPDALKDLSWNTCSSSPGRAEPVSSPGPLVANTSPFRNSPPGHGPPAGDPVKPPGVDETEETMVAATARGSTQQPPAIEGSGVWDRAGVAGTRCSSSADVALSRRGWTQLPLSEPPCRPCSPQQKPCPA